jgi:hypothetical protein
MDAREIGRLRLRNQRLAGARFSSAEEVVGWLGAVQSQEYELARWSLGQRSVGVTEADVEAAVERGSILRTHILRPTWHYVLPADIRSIMRLTAPRVDVQNRQWHQRFGLEEPDFDRGLEIVRQALGGGRPMTRRQLEGPLRDGGFETGGQRLAYLFIRAERDLLVVSGGRERGRNTYVLTDGRLPLDTGFDRDQALADLTQRYFASHGPATVGDFGWWSSLTAAEVRRGLGLVAEAGTPLERLTADDADYWLAADAAGSLPSLEPTSAIQLLQGFDEYLVGYRPTRSVANADGLARRAVLGGLPYLHLVVADGQVVGYWRRVRRDGGFAVETWLLRALDRGERAALEAETDRYAAFTGCAVALA